jgi:uncharacterized surface protein with fasciclin (FAS1) repeats
MTRSRGWRSPLIAALVALAACSGTDDTPTSQASASPSRHGSLEPVVKITIPEPSGLDKQLDIVTPKQARTMSIADVLRQDERFTVFGQLAEHTKTGASGFPTWLELLDRPASQLGDDHEGMTIFVPTDEAFTKVEQAIRDALDDGLLVNAERYWLLGYHTVHRLFPSPEFQEGSVGSWAGDVQMTIDPLAYGGQPILETDLRVANGYIHVIGGVVVPDLVIQAAERG